MSKSSAGTILCEPTRLYNILTQGAEEPAILQETYLVLFDCREISAYYIDHVILARTARCNNPGMRHTFHIPVDINLPTIQNCIVYDSKTISKFEDTPAVQFANLLASNGSKNPVMILKGGYERFSAEYPFLRTEKIMNTPRELQHLPRYPSEIIPLFLYLGDKGNGYNAATNYELKIHAHIILGEEIVPPFPGKVHSLQLDIKDDPQDSFSFSEICEFIETCWNKSERVLVYEDKGCSRSATVAMAYLIKRNNIKVKEAYEHVKKCRQDALPIEAFLEQLSNWEKQLQS